MYPFLNNRSISCARKYTGWVNSSVDIDGVFGPFLTLDAFNDACNFPSFLLFSVKNCVYDGTEVRSPSLIWAGLSSGKKRWSDFMNFVVKCCDFSMEIDDINRWTLFSKQLNQIDLSMKSTTNSFRIKTISTYRSKCAFCVVHWQRFASECKWLMQVSSWVAWLCYRLKTNSTDQRCSSCQ